MHDDVAKTCCSRVGGQKKTQPIKHPSLLGKGKGV